MHDNRCYGKAILKKLSNVEFLQLYLCPKDDWEKQEKTSDAKKVIVRSATPGKGREGGLCSMKVAEEVNMEAESTRVPIWGTRHCSLVLVNEQTHTGETHTLCTQNASPLRLKDMLRSGALSGLIAWAWNGTAGVWETVSIYYKPVCSPGCTSTDSTGRIRPFRKGMSCCSAGQPMPLPPLLVIQGKLRLLFQLFFMQAVCANQLSLFQMENVVGRTGLQLVFSCF